MFSIKSGYREAMAFQIYSVVGLLIVPFSLWSLWQGYYVLAVPPLLTALLTCINIYSYLLYRRLWIAPFLVSVCYIGDCALVISQLGQMGAYWAFPTMLAIYWVHERRTALVTVTLLLVTILTTAGFTLPPDATLRLATTLVLTAVFFNIAAGMIERQRAELERLTITDHLTAAYNRRFMDGKIEELIERFKRTASPAAMVVLDIDHFKQINDRYGHSVGDRVLIELVELLKSRLRAIDCVCRAGGEEFAILLQDTNEAQAQQVGEELRKTIDESPLLKNSSVTISCGVGAVRPGDTRESWLRRCDQALYRAKRSGRNTVAVGDQEATPTPAGSMDSLAGV